ncbi:hypothetical protein FACS18948_3480 [Clostridia bacterium]|nr:hypothetical protein FACS18948_3480 [Clostridia bacterium]
MIMKKLWPGTLNLADRARLALNSMISVSDEDYDGIPFFSGHLRSDAENPAWISHGNWDYGSSHGRLIDSIAIVREMTGTTDGRDIEDIYKRNLLSFIRDDGLCYRQNSFSDEELTRLDAPFRAGAPMIDQRAVILGLGTWYADTGDDRVKGYADRHVAALKRIARKERESWYYTASEYFYEPKGWPSADAVNTRLAYDPCAMWGRQIGPILTWHKLTGNADALELCEMFAANITLRSGAFLADGSWNGALEYRNGHFHTRMGTLLSLARFAEYTGNAGLAAWVETRYRWALNNWCTTFGWTPGDMHDQGYEHETCTLVDAIGCAISLAKQGYHQYWQKAEKFIRNHLVESQLIDTSWVHQLDTKAHDIPGRKTFYKVGDRLRGSFAGYAAPNDFVYSGMKGRGHILDVQVCCVASGARGLYYGWKHIVTEKRGRVSVNFLLNRSTEWLDVESLLPNEGRVILRIKKEIADLAFRVPDWAHYGAVSVRYEGAGGLRCETGRTLSYIDDCFIKLGGAVTGDTITIIFPVPERETTERAIDDIYKVKWLGDNVSGISPEGTYFPLYARGLSASSAPVMEREIFPGTGKRFE